jgi:hypothetical protein
VIVVVAAAVIVGKDWILIAFRLVIEVNFVELRLVHLNQERSGIVIVEVVD